MTKLPPLNALKAFEAAARHLSFTLAAAELHVTHGAVSRQVAALETHLGVSLFVRGTRGLRPTPAGQQLARSVASAFDLLRSAAEQVRPQREASTLRVSVPPTLAMWWLIPRLTDLRDAVPLRMDLSTSIEPIDFGSGAYDAAIRRIGAAPRGSGVRRFLDARQVPVCSPAYQKKLRVRGVADLARATLLATRSEPQAWPDWLRRRRIAGLQAADVVEFEQLFFALQAALDGMGVAIAPDCLVALEVERGRLVRLAEPQGPVTPTYALVWPLASPHVEACRELGEWLRQQGGMCAAPRAARG
jgi:LysR family glycine cleavage system transcriptional activator